MSMYMLSGLHVGKAKIVTRCPRARVQRDEILPGGIVLYRVRSESQKGAWYYVAADLTTGQVECGCKDFECRKGSGAGKMGTVATVSTPAYWCKHVAAIVWDMAKNGEVEVGLTCR